MICLFIDINKQNIIVLLNYLKFRLKVKYFKDLKLNNHKNYRLSLNYLKFNFKKNNINICLILIQNQLFNHH